MVGSCEHLFAQVRVAGRQDLWIKDQLSLIGLSHEQAAAGLSELQWIKK